VVAPGVHIRFLILYREGILGALGFHYFLCGVLAARAGSGVRQV
jgi:hypothetical protein